MEQALDIHQWLNTPHDKGGPSHADIVRPTEIWAGPLCKSAAQWHTGAGAHVSRLMKAVVGWTRVRFGVRDGKDVIMVKAYIRDGSQMALDHKVRNDYILHHHAPSSAQGDFTPSATTAA
jgi:hypothetical protein